MKKVIATVVLSTFMAGSAYATSIGVDTSGKVSAQHGNVKADSKGNVGVKTKKGNVNVGKKGANVKTKHGTLGVKTK